MPPPNLTPATAIPITTFPFTVAVDPGASANTLFYKVTGTAATVMVGIWVDNTTWATGHFLTQVVIKNADGVTDYLGGFYVTDVALQVPVPPGQVIYIQLESGAGTYTAGDLIHLSVILPPAGVIGPGQLLINDDTNFFPLIALTETGTVVAFKAFPAGERGAILPSGVSLWQDRAAAGFNPGGTGVFGNVLHLADAALTPIADITGVIANTDTTECVITTDRDSTFYVVQNQSAQSLLRTISPTGVVDALVRTLPANGKYCTAACPNVAKTILYYVTYELNQPVRRYDLATQLEVLPVLLPAQGANVSALKDLLVFPDDTILVGFYNNSGSTQTFKLLHLTPAGAILRQWDYNGNNGMAGQVANRLTYNAAQDGASFWVWLYRPIDPDETTWEFTVQSEFVELSLTTGAVLQSVLVQNYEVGGSSGSQFWDGVRFGPSTSCPFLVYPSGDDGGDGEPGSACAATSAFPIDPVTRAVRRWRPR